MDESSEDGDVLINAFGLYWVRQAVNWEERKLHGMRMHAKLTRKNSVEKERAVDVSTQQGIYALYSDAKLLYVGLAMSEEGIGDRLRSHHTKPRLSGRWDTFSWFGINGFDQTGAKRNVPSIKTDPNTLIRTMELLVILVSDPPMNRASGRFAGAERINQHLKHMIPQVTNAELMKVLENIQATLKPKAKKTG